ncbi:MAG: hypothetical protein CMP27_08425 [Roseibacillus sp.]|nr:hypothetical protein [Roseibacillus sp.]
MSYLQVQSVKSHQSQDSVVCHCHGVTEVDLRLVIRETGASSVEEVSSRTKAGTGCGACRCKLNRVLSGLPADCGRFGLCQQCGFANVLCTCSVAKRSEVSSLRIVSGQGR